MVGVFQKLVEDVRVVKEQKKKLDKYGDKYVSALTRYGQLSPKKEMNVFEQVRTHSFFFKKKKTQ